MSTRFQDDLETTGVASSPTVDPLSSLVKHLEGFSGQLTGGERNLLSALIEAGSRDPALVALASEPAEKVLDPAEIAIVDRLLAAPPPVGRAWGPLLVFIMKATLICNLRCTYCRSWSDDPKQVMSFEVLARAIHAALSVAGARVVEFIWHGGESTLRPISFYRKALWLQQLFRKPGQKVTNSMQSNGVTLNDQWLDFVERYKIGVGISLDGPPEIHDRRRLDVRGRPTLERVRQSLERLRMRRIPHSLLAVVDDDVVALGPERLLEYLLEIDARSIALLNVGPEGEPDRALPGDYLQFSRYVEFLCELFRLWWPKHVDRIRFREISDLLKKIQSGYRGGECIFGENCVGKFLTIEPLGDVTHCDKYQGDSNYRFGNVLSDDFADIISSPNLLRIHAQAQAGMERTENCPWFEFCQGGCPHDRYLRLHRGVSHDEGCCGWAPLFTEIATAVGRGTVLSTSWSELPRSGQTPTRKE